MATYLPGVTDYIPNIQPFKPDFNFYQKALESKEADYKAGYDKISNLYGTLLNSDMLRADNNETRDKFFTQVQSDIQRMSTVDLSLKQNVSTAYQAFQPLIEDKNVAKDMVFTKKYKGQKSYAQYLKTCFEKDCKDKYWDDGLRALDYQAQDFIEADKESALHAADPSYTPYSNGYQKAMTLAKDMGIEIQNVSHDATGKFLVTTKNGSKLTGPLANYFVTAMSNDAATVDVYKTKAYVARKDYMTQYASKYGGDKDKAERAYLAAAPATIMNVMNDYANLTNQAVATQTTKKKIMDKKIEKEGVNPTAQADFVKDWFSTQEQIEVNTAAAAQYEGAISTIKKADVDDIANLRARVDQSMSQALLVEDMASAANSYAQLHKSESWVADPYAVAATNHSYRLQEMGQKFDYDVFMEKYKNDLKNGTVAGPREWEQLEVGPGDAGKVPLKTSVGAMQDRFGKEAKDAALEYNKRAFDYYDNLRLSKDPDEAKYGAEQLKKIFTNHIDQSFVLKDFESNPELNIEGSPNSWKAVYTRAAEALKGDKHILNDPDGSFASSLGQMEKAVSRKLEAQSGINARSQQNNRNTANIIQQNGTSKFKRDADLLVDKDGREVTPQAFKDAYIARHFTAKDEFRNYDPQDAYNELSTEFIDAYNRKLAPGMKDVYPDGGKGGGLGTAPMKTRYDAASISMDDRQDLNSLRNDIAKPGAFVLTGDNMIGEEGKTYSSVDNNKAASQVFHTMLDLMGRGGWDPKTEGGKNRPILDLVVHPSALGRPGYQAYTLTLDPLIMETMRGTENKKGVASSFYNADGTLKVDKITMYIPDAEAKNNFKTRAALSDYDIIMNTTGKYTVDDYSEGGGTADVSRDGKGNFVVNASTQFVNDDGTYGSEAIPRFYSTSPLDNTTDFVEGIELNLKNRQQVNAKLRQQTLDLLKKTKSPQQLANSVQ